jgi:hypothetical protein
MGTIGHKLEYIVHGVFEGYEGLSNEGKCKARRK